MCDARAKPTNLCWPRGSALTVETSAAADTSHPGKQADAGRKGEGAHPSLIEANLRLAHMAFVEHKPRITALDWRDCLEREASRWDAAPRNLLRRQGPLQRV